jgi:sulfur-carrier protein
MLKVLYFASIREAVGVAEESVALPTPATLNVLIHTLRARGGAYAEALDPARRWRVALNQDLASLESTIQAGDEVAIFPPVTGG